ncbi:hypothetical protein HWV62_18058 [Athelia sp. TMB]|nr:hypothetical protein HWV62_18058 [Athelia sp. TMB]
MHRDPAPWNMDVTLANRRRTLFWEVYSADIVHSLALGRPPSIVLSYVDCALPQPQGATEAEAQFWNWKYQFNRNIFSSVIQLTLGATSPDYKAILEVDRRVREMALPPALDMFTTGDHDDVSLNVYMKGGYLAMAILRRIKEKASTLFTDQLGHTKHPDATSQTPIKYDQCIDELAMFSGQSRGLISRQRSPGAMDQAAEATNVTSEAPVSLLAPAGSFVQPTDTILPSSAKHAQTGMPDARTSLMEQISLLPEIAATSSAHTEHDAFSPHTLARGDFAFPYNLSDMSVHDLSFLEIPAKASTGTEQSHVSSIGFSCETTSIDPFHQLYSETLAPNSWEMDAIREQSISIDIGNSQGIDADWMAFMKEVGLV